MSLRRTTGKYSHLGKPVVTMFMKLRICHLC